MNSERDLVICGWDKTGNNFSIETKIITRIETERAIVHGNWELFKIYEETVKKVIERVWEG